MIGHRRLRRDVKVSRGWHLLEMVVRYGRLERLGTVSVGLPVGSELDEVVVAVISRRFAIRLRNVARRPARGRRRRRWQRQRCLRRSHGFRLRVLLVVVHVERRQKSRVPATTESALRFAFLFRSFSKSKEKFVAHSFAYFLFSVGASRASFLPEFRCHFSGAPPPGRPHGHQSLWASSANRTSENLINVNIQFGKWRRWWRALASLPCPLLALYFHKRGLAGHKCVTSTLLTTAHATAREQRIDCLPVQRLGADWFTGRKLVRHQMRVDGPSIDITHLQSSRQPALPPCPSSLDPHELSSLYYVSHVGLPNNRVVFPAPLIPITAVLLVTMCQWFAQRWLQVK